MIRVQFLLGADIFLSASAQETVSRVILASSPMDDGLFFKVKAAGA
jgi:hypothetical protein